MEYYRIGYVGDQTLPEVTREDALTLTHINLAFGLIRDGLLDLSRLKHLSCLPQIRSWNPALRIVLSVGGWGAGGFSTMAMTEEGRMAFAQSCLQAVERYQLDGIDIDWEYPCSDQAEIDADPRDKDNYTHLFEALRTVLGKERIVSTAVGAGAYFTEGTRMDQVAQLVDYVQLMTYDMRNGFTPQAGHHAALDATKGDPTPTNTRCIVELFHEAGVPYEKLIVGAAFYSRIFTDVRNENNGLLQPGSVGNYGPFYFELDEAYRQAHGFREYWDEDAQAAYLWNGDTFVSFESPEAIRRKCLYVKEKQLGGLMYWEHRGDAGRELLRVIGGNLS